ncbi:UBA-like domain DUF1421 [Dillenia turbinata]|uniref:UBA-like domain DUF1421 n=1 Tax=Dillenia turbinata TaxID=194707 RepID=A0AAN8V7A0_9MAGN
MNLGNSIDCKHPMNLSESHPANRNLFYYDSTDDDEEEAEYERSKAEIKHTRFLPFNNINPFSVSHSQDSTLKAYGSVGQFDSVGNRILVSVIDHKMKEHSEILRQRVDSLTTRLSQLERRMCNIETSMDDFKSSAAFHYGRTERNLKHLETMFNQVQDGVKCVKDKQEILETQLELARFQMLQTGMNLQNQTSAESLGNSSQPESLSEQEDSNHDLIALSPPCGQPCLPPVQTPQLEFPPPVVLHPWSPPSMLPLEPGHCMDSTDPWHSEQVSSMTTLNASKINDTYGGYSSCFGNSCEDQSRSMLDGSSHLRLPIVRLLPEALPTDSSDAQKSVAIDDIAEKVIAMGFRRDLVRSTVRKLLENGQKVELNLVLDTLMGNK